MQIWVDADACPKVIKEILFRASARRGIDLILVANHQLQVPPSSLVSTIRVSLGADVADREIVDKIAVGDLVVTADIPLAAATIAQKGHALNPRGEFYSPENIGERLSMRNFLTDLRDNGVVTGGPAPLTQRDRQNFANQLDRFLAKSDHPQ
ncbi:MAG: YaiI/YqxD family protein [Proteobacteria bacterium]|nr:YaiI/YqxD family protein [Pseudomonadota bacterium]MBU1687207.1 YaiI/YqxD family protein [Pseudomonadota bacterium]